jgi:hypothetical protein
MIWPWQVDDLVLVRYFNCCQFRNRSQRARRRSSFLRSSLPDCVGVMRPNSTI